MLKNYMTCRWLHLCLGFILVCSTAGDCLFPPKEFPNGRILYERPKDANKSTAPDQYLLRYRCHRGYTGIGFMVSICSKSQWSNSMPTCIRVECSDPPKIKNAQFKLQRGEKNLTTIRAEAVYSCDVGFELLNETASTLICIINKNLVTWKGKMPSCKEKESCPDPGVSKEGSREGNCCSVSDNLRYSCNAGYELVGQAEIECLSTGNWTSKRPLCQQKVSCPDPGVSKDGSREGSCFRVGEILRYSCNEDYELVGQEEIECLPTGNWTFGRPLCRPLGIRCAVPPAIPHGEVVGSIEGDYYRQYDTVQIVCELGYSHPEENSLIECEEEGEWETEFGECTEIFCDPPAVLENGTITELLLTNLTSFPFNFELTYVCDKGFRLIGGDSWRICVSSGWSGKTPHCEVIKCPDPGVPDHGARTGNSFEIGSKIHFKCFTGYELIGSFERYCRPNGQWTGELARCDTESNYCPDPGIPINGYRNSTNYDMGSIVGFRCRSGYFRIGSEARVCQPNRTWSGDETACLGKYEFDNRAEIRDSLKIILSENSAEQERNQKEYNKTLLNSGFLTKSPNLPKRLIYYFVFDVSGNVRKGNFLKSIELAKAIVKKVGITTAGARAGALTFSSRARIEFWPFDYNTTEGVLDALDKINFTDGGKPASSVLSDEVIPTTQIILGKEKQKSIVFILAVGRTNMGWNTQMKAKALKDAGVEIYCIGIAGNVEFLWNIASTPKKEHVFILKDYQTLAWLVQELTSGTVDYSQCGLGMETVGNRLPHARAEAGSKSATPWPWMAAIYFLQPGTADVDKAELKCAGSIIDKHFILTAAHCMFYYHKKHGWLRRDEKEVVVKLGLTYVKNETFVQEHMVKHIYTHFQYHSSYIHHDYDIALLQLNTPIEFNAYVRPICLPPKDLPVNSTFYKSHEFGLVMGWGHQRVIKNDNSFLNKISNHLKEMILPIQSRDRCIQSLVEKRHHPDFFTDRMFCAGNVQKDNNICHGDSGGPLMQSQINDEGYRYWTQVGVVSWGLDCGDANSYGFYSHVQKLRDWIDETIKNAKKEYF